MLINYFVNLISVLVMSLIGSLLTMLVESFFSCKLMWLLLLVVVMLHLVQGYIIMKLVYFIILTFISMADIDTSLCLFPEHCERENNPVAGMASTYYYYWFTTIVMYVLCKSWLSNSTHFGICLKPIANNPLYTIVMLNHSVWIWTPPWIGGCRVIGFINACKWFMEFKLEVQSLHCYCFLWAILIAWLSYLLLTSIIYMVLLFLRSTLYYNYFSRCCIMFLWDIFSPLQNCWEFEALKFLGHSNSKRNSNHVLWICMIFIHSPFPILDFASLLYFMFMYFPMRAPFVTTKKSTANTIIFLCQYNVCLETFVVLF